MELFLQKNAKFSSAGGSAPRPPCLRRLGLRPQTSQTAPPLRISGYAPDTKPIFCLKIGNLWRRIKVTLTKD